MYSKHVMLTSSSVLLLNNTRIFVCLNHSYHLPSVFLVSDSTWLVNPLELIIIMTVFFQTLLV